jgi:hypothetical protein
MNGDRPQDALKLVAVVAAIALVTIVSHAGTWLASLGRWVHHGAAALTAPRTLVCVVLAIGLVLGAIRLRRRVGRDLLADRVELQLVPSSEFDPPVEAVSRLAAQLARTRRRGRGWLERSAAAVRIGIASDEAGRLGYRISAPAHARTTLHAALGEYADLDIREAPPLPGRDGGAVARCELVLARPAHEPLAQLGLGPDPLQPLAAVLAGLDAGRGERATVSVDVLALTTGEARRWRRRAQRRIRRREHREDPAPTSPHRSPASQDPLGLNDLFGGPVRSARRDAVATARHREVVDGLRVKLAGHAPLLAVQILLEVRAADRASARVHLRALLSCFDQFAGPNHWRAVGSDLPALGFTGSDGLLRRRRFDRRMASGRFAAPRRNVVTAAEIAGCSSRRPSTATRPT